MHGVGAGRAAAIRSQRQGKAPLFTRARAGTDHPADTIAQQVDDNCRELNATLLFSFPCPTLLRYEGVVGGHPLQLTKIDVHHIDL